MVSVGVKLIFILTGPGLCSLLRWCLMLSSTLGLERHIIQAKNGAHPQQYRAQYMYLLYHVL